MASASVSPVAGELVAGVDSSTQSCKVLIVDAATGAVVRSGAAPHPDGTECDPAAWWDALVLAVERAGGLRDVAAISVGGQQHGMVLLDAAGDVIRPAQLWNDTKSGAAAADLVAELGAQAWAQATGLVPVASFTVTKLRWMADHEPANAARIAAVCLPHDWLTWRLTGAHGLSTLVTDRSDASGTGYFDPVADEYRRDLVARALRIDAGAAEAIVLPQVLGCHDSGGEVDPGVARALGADGGGRVLVGPGCGDNAGAALGLGLRPGDVQVSLGTSGVVAAVSATPVRDASGMVAGFADALGGFLPLTVTLNAARILDATARVLGVGHDELDALALAAEQGAGGLVQIPHLEGERTPNLPDATGTLVGMTMGSFTRENLARAAVEGLLCLQSVGVDAQRAQGVAVDKVTLVGGAARSAAVRRLAPAVLGVPVEVPEPGEYVALGAARQAAWVLSGGDEPPVWAGAGVQRFEAEPQPWLRERYDAVAAQVETLSGTRRA